MCSILFAVARRCSAGIPAGTKLVHHICRQCSEVQHSAHLVHYVTPWKRRSTSWYTRKPPGTRR